MPHCSTRRTASIRALRHALAAAVALLAAACASQPVPAQSSAPPPRPAQAVAAMDLAGQKVLVLPVQAAGGLQQSRDEVTRELLFALGERDTRRASAITASATCRAPWAAWSAATRR
jgi:hypothetical protein